MGMTMAEKILARASGRDKVAPGDFVTAAVDFVMGNDVSFPQAVRYLREAGIEKVPNPDRICVAVDHSVPAMTPGIATMHKEMREMAAALGITRVYDAGTGIEHAVLPEKGHALPGWLVLGCDSHSTTYGALATAGTGIGARELAYVMYKLSTWFQVPPSIRIVLDGELGPGVSSKDAMLALMGRLGCEAGQYKSLEFTGSAADALSVDARMTMSNIGVEMGAKFAMFAADQKTLDYLRPRTSEPISVFGPDPDASYESEHRLDCSSLEPQVACPHTPDNVKPVSELGDVAVQQAFIGSCTNARTEDLLRAASILKGRHIAPGTRLLVIPSSHEVMVNATRNGSIATLVEAGAMVGTPGCGPCGGGSTGVLGAGENGIASTNRNFMGRMGSPESFNYLASPETVAASAIAGKIADPRKYLQ